MRLEKEDFFDEYLEKEGQTRTQKSSIYPPKKGLW
jgi:hypothetical protein